MLKGLEHMINFSYFRNFGNLILVKNICSPIRNTYEADTPSQVVWEEWMEDSADPNQHIGLVARDKQIEGWFGFDMLKPNSLLCDCMGVILPKMIISADTSILEVIPLFTDKTKIFYLVLQGTSFIGVLDFRDIFKLPFRLALFALILQIEKLMLDIILTAPNFSVSLLSQGKVEKAKDVYHRRGYSYDNNGQPYASTLLECTTLIHKFNILKKCRKTRLLIPELQSNFTEVAERMRNELAHPSTNNDEILSRDILVPFVNWAEQFQQSMQRFLESNERMDK